MVFGSPFSDKYPARVWEGLKKSRKGKDAFAPFYKFVNSTKIYDHVLKYTHGYLLFSIFGGCVSLYCLSSVCDAVWKRANKGRLYIDLEREAQKAD